MSRALATVVKAFRTDGGMCCRYSLMLARASRDAALRVWQLAGAAARLKDAVRVAGIAFEGGRDVSDCLIRPEVALGAAACGDVLADGTGLACGSPGMIAAPGVVAPGDEAPGDEAPAVEALGVVARGVEALGVVARGLEALGVVARGVGALGVAALGFAALGVAALGVETLGVAALGVETLGVEALGVAAAGVAAGAML
jgi:hypothetical protein